MGSVVVSTSNRHRKNVLSRIEQLNIAGRAMKVQWKPQDIFNIFVWKYLLHDTLGATF